MLSRAATVLVLFIEPARHRAARHRARVIEPARHRVIGLIRTCNVDSVVFNRFQASSITSTAALSTSTVVRSTLCWRMEPQGAEETEMVGHSRLFAPVGWFSNSDGIDVPDRPARQAFS